MIPGINSDNEFHRLFALVNVAMKKFVAERAASRNAAGESEREMRDADVNVN